LSNQSHNFIESGASVILGSYDQVPNYAEIAASLGANIFDPPQRLWKFLTASSETWTATQTFLDTAIRRNSLFCLLTPPLAALRGGSYWTELDYLISRGTTSDRFQLIRFPLSNQTQRQTLSPLRSLLGWDNRRLARKRHEQLIQEVNENLQFLFTECGGKIIANEAIPFPPAFDYAFVTIATKEMLFRIAQGREDLGVSIAPQHAPDDWQELSMVLMAMSTPEGVGSRPAYVFLRDVAQLLRMQIKPLREALSENRWIAISERLTRLYCLPFKEQWEAVNRKI
jgi:hypothetical protein